MTRPTVLDMDLVVVPREADDAMLEPTGDSYSLSTLWDAMLSPSPYPTAWDDVRKYVEGLEERLVSVAGPCSLGVGCEQYGVCYADAHGNPEECGKPSFECEALKDARRIADHDKKLWLDAEARIAELEKRLADADVVVEPFADGRAKITHANGCRYHGGHDCDCGKDDYLRAARAYMEGK